jgi:Zn-finger nucleic acid-binding protein
MFAIFFTNLLSGTAGFCDLLPFNKSVYEINITECPKQGGIWH